MMGKQKPKVYQVIFRVVWSVFPVSGHAIRSSVAPCGAPVKSIDSLLCAGPELKLCVQMPDKTFIWRVIAYPLQAVSATVFLSVVEGLDCTKPAFFLPQGFADGFAHVRAYDMYMRLAIYTAT